jgi:hypothetical protein
MLELAEEALDQIALAVDTAADGALNQSLTSGGDMSLGAAGSDHVQKSVGVVATVGYDIAAFEPFQQQRRSTQIVSLPGGQNQPDR